jgi:hypothetical protein
VFTAADLDQLTARAGLAPARRQKIHAAAAVTGFRVTSYITDELIDWSAAPDDPVYRLYFPDEAIPARAGTGLARRAAPGTQAVARQADGRPAPGRPRPAEPTPPGLRHAGHDTVLVVPAREPAGSSYAIRCPGKAWPACFGIIVAVPGMTTAVAPFLLVYGVSYFFTEFGPNMTTFAMPSELYPVAMRATGHGISAGMGKLGAFIGVFLFPVLNSSLGLRGTLLLTAGVSVAGMALTFVLPEPARRSLEEMPVATSAAAPQPLRVADPAQHRAGLICCSAGKREDRQRDLVADPRIHLRLVRTVCAAWACLRAGVACVAWTGGRYPDL